MKKHIKLCMIALVLAICIFMIALISCNKNGGDENTDHTEHTYGEWVTKTQSECETAGKQIRRCTECDATEEQEIPALGHSFGEYVSDNNASCKDGTKTAVCVRNCGKKNTVIDEGSGSGEHITVYYKTVEASCTEPSMVINKCKNCDYFTSSSIAPAIGHLVSNYVVKSKTPISGSNCGYSVELIGSCTNCAQSVVTETKTEVNHKYCANIKVYATCVSNGTMEYKCSVCNDSFTEIYSDSYAHSWEIKGSPVNGVQQYKCSRTSCSAVKSVIVSENPTHTVSKTQLSGAGVSLSNISLELDSKTLGALSDGDITLTAMTLGESDRENLLSGLSDDKKALIGDSAVYDFEMKQDNALVNTFAGKITITVPYTLKNGEDPECLVVWYISADGSIESIPAIYSLGNVIFEVEHFSVYTVTSVTPVMSCETNGHDYETGVSTVAPTCTSVGYTVKACTRCGKSIIGDIVPETGHRYSTAPIKVEPTCNSKGMYTYTCSVSGCDHKQEILIQESHDWSYKSYFANTCQRDGYTEYECTLCLATKKDIIPLDPMSHDLANGYKFADGGTVCTDGVITYVYCKNDGCDYYQENETWYAHIEDRENLPQITPTKIDLRDYFSDLYFIGDDGGYITVTPYYCICQKIHQSVEINFGSAFDTMEIYTADRFSSHYDSERLFNSRCFEPNENKCKYIKVVTRSENDGCLKSYFLDILIDYKPSTGNAVSTITLLMDSEISHNTEISAYPAFNGADCDDGVILEWKCIDCNKITGRQTQTVSRGEHYYIYNQLPYDMSQYAGNGHKPKIALGRCVCGSSKYTVVYDNGTMPNKRCSFSKSTQSISSNITETTYTCSCGFKYMERKTVERNVTNCIIKRETQKIFYDYNAQTGEFEKSISITGNIETKLHNNEMRDVEVQKYGTCYFEYTAKLFCKYCNKLCNDYYSYSGSRYVHNISKTQSTDDMGNTVVTEICAECGYSATYVTNSDGERVTSNVLVFDPKAQLSIETFKNYKDENGTNVEIYSKQTVHDIEGNVISWEQIATLYAYGTDRGDIKNVITIRSDGSVEVTETILG